MSHDSEPPLPPPPVSETAPPGAPEPARAAPPDRDQTLVVAARQGDRAAFAELVQRHQSAVFAYFRTRLLQAADAEDLTQEVFMRCYTSWARFDTSAMIRPWLLGIARNLLHEYIRRVKRRREKEVAWAELCLELDEMVSSDESVYGDLLDHLPTCLDSLGESARQAIEMRYGAQLRLNQIGEKLHRSEGAAKLLMFRARQALKNCLGRKFQGDDP